jgi:DNA-binding CsgD family transcriptional regulator
MTKIQIPSGLIDDNIELFSAQGKMMATHSGTVKSLFDLPEPFLRKLTVEMHSVPSVIKALIHAGYKTENEQLEKYAECKFGGFDLTADFKDGKFSDSEYHECGFRGICPMEGIVCGFFKVNGQIISPFEIQMIKHLATDDTLPVIAEKLKISINNFENKKQKLFTKLSVQSRPKLVARGYDLQILNLKLCS